MPYVNSKDQFNVYTQYILLMICSYGYELEINCG